MRDPVVIKIKYSCQLFLHTQTFVSTRAEQNVHGHFAPISGYELKIGLETRNIKPQTHSTRRVLCVIR